MVVMSSLPAGSLGSSPSGLVPAVISLGSVRPKTPSRPGYWTFHANYSSTTRNWTAWDLSGRALTRRAQIGTANATSRITSTSTTPASP